MLPRLKRKQRRNLSDTAARPPLGVKDISCAGSNLENKHEGEEKFLLTAVSRGDLETIRHLIDAGADLECNDEGGNTPLHIAVLNGQTRVAALLVDAGADTEIVNTDWETPLHLAVIHGHEQTALELLERNADLGARDKEGNTPLHLACLHGYVSLAQTLISREADVRSLNVVKATPLHLAAKFGGLETVKALLMTAVDVDALDSFGDSPLHFAVRGGKAEIVRKILMVGASRTRVNENGDSPLHAACKVGNTDAVGLLLNEISTVSLNGGNKQGKSPLHLAAEHQHADIAKKLIAAGADINGQDEDGNSAYDLVPGFCKDLKKLLLPERSAMADTPRNAVFERPTRSFLKTGIPRIFRRKRVASERRRSVLCPTSDGDAAISLEPIEARSDSFSEHIASDTTRVKNLFRQQTVATTAKSAIGQQNRLAGSVSLHVPLVPSMDSKNASHNRRDHDAVKNLREGDIIGRYAIDGDSHASSSWIRSARNRETGEEVWLEFCEDKSSLDKWKSVYKRLEGTGYVSRLVEIVEEDCGFPAFLVIQRGYHNLRQVLKDGEFDKHSKIQCLKQLSMGIDELHERGVMHGDLSLCKIEFFTIEHRWKLTCLGCSDILVQPGGPQSSSLHSPREPIEPNGGNIAITARRAFDRWCYILVLLDVFTGASDVENSSLVPEDLLRKSTAKATMEQTKEPHYRQLLEDSLLSLLRRHLNSTTEDSQSEGLEDFLRLVAQATQVDEVKSMKALSDLTHGPLQLVDLGIATSV